MRTNGLMAAVIVGLVLVCASATAVAADADKGWLAMADETKKTTETAVAAPVPAPAAKDAAPEWTKPIPLSFSIGYTLVSDYIFRGVNFSEYPGEGREKLNHQMNVNTEYDTGTFGVFGVNAWFEWYAAQQKLTPWTGSDLQEVDYSAYWRYAIAPIGTTVETGWVAYTYPPFNKSDAHAAGFSDDAATDYEWYVKVSFDDSKWFGTSAPVLNPYVAYYHDLDLAKNTSWWEVGISHPFALKDFGCAAVPVMKDVTVTPSVVLGTSHRYYGGLGLTDSKYTRLANILYGLDMSYDLSGALGMPAKYGKVAVGGFLNYSQALDREVLDDQFFGGVKATYSW